MDGTLTLIFAKLNTAWNITTKISAFLQLRKKWIFTKYEGCGSKIGPATPIWSFRCFWREIQIQGTKSLQIWYKAGNYWGEQLVKIWCWYLKPLLRNWNLSIFSSRSESSNTGFFSRLSIVFPSLSLNFTIFL